MSARMVLNGREVPRVHLLMQEIDTVTDSLWDLPKGHPDYPVHLSRLDKLTDELLVHRRKDWVRA